MESLLPSSRAGSQVVAPGSSQAHVTTVAAGTLKARLGQFSHTGGLQASARQGGRRAGEAGTMLRLNGELRRTCRSVSL